MAEDGTGVDPAVIEAVREAAEAMGAAASRLEGDTGGGGAPARETRLAREKNILGQIAGIYQQIESSIKNSFDAGSKLGDTLADMALNTEKTELSLKNLLGTAKSLGSSFMNIGKQIANMPTTFHTIGSQMSKLAAAVNPATLGIAALTAVVGTLVAAAGAAVAITIKFVDAIIKLSISLIDAENAFMRTTGASQLLASQITTTYAEMRQFGVTIEDASGSLNALFKDFKDFTLLNEQQQKTLVQTASILGRLGVAHGDFAKSVEIGTKMMGVSIDQSDEMMLKMRRQAQALGVDVGVLTSQFASGGAEFAKFGATGVDTFVDLARVSKITGMELTKLLNMVNKFDTFDGAAEQAGKLNAMLGGNFVNAMDLMMTTDPVDRFEMIRGAIENAGLSFDTMSYYQRKFYADSLGLDSVGDLALMLSGNMSDLSAEVNKTSADYARQAQEARDLQSVQDQFKTLLIEMTPVVMGVQRAIKGFFRDMRDPENQKAIADLGEQLWRMATVVLEAFGVKSTKGADLATMFVGALQAMTATLKFVGAGFMGFIKLIDMLLVPLTGLFRLWDILTGQTNNWRLAIASLLEDINGFLVTLAIASAWIPGLNVVMGGAVLAFHMVTGAIAELLKIWDEWQNGGQIGWFEGFGRVLANAIPFLAQLKQLFWDTYDALIAPHSLPLIEGFMLLPKIFSAIGTAAKMMLNPFSSIAMIMDKIIHFVTDDIGESPLMQTIDRMVTLAEAVGPQAIDLLAASLGVPGATAQANTAPINLEITMPVHVGDEKLETKVKRWSIDGVNKTMTDHALGIGG